MVVIDASGGEFLFGLSNALRTQRHDGRLAEGDPAHALGLGGLVPGALQVPPKPATRAREKTAFQLQRAEEIYDLFVFGFSTRRIVEKLTTPGPDGAAPRFTHLDRGTVMRDIADERQRRVEKDGEKSEQHRADAVALYGVIKERALADESCSHLFEALKAQERIDKILGIDQPVKLDLRLSDLWAKVDAGLLSLGDDHR